jgi:hypothetical protein
MRIDIPVTSIRFGESMVSNNSLLQVFRPQDYATLRIEVSATSPSASALETSIRTGTFNQALLETFLNDQQNVYSCYFTNGGTPNYSAENSGRLVISGSEIKLIPLILSFNLPSFVEFERSGYAAQGDRYDNGSPGILNLNSVTSSSLKYQIDNSRGSQAASWTDFDNALRALFASNDINSYFSAFSNLIIAEKRYLGGDHWDEANIDFAVRSSTLPNVTRGHSDVTNAILDNGRIILSASPDIRVDLGSVQILAGPIAEVYSPSAVFISSTAFSPELAFLYVGLRKEFSIYPEILINQLSSASGANKASIINQLSRDPSVVLRVTAESGIDLDLTGDRNFDGESFVLGVSSAAYVNGQIVITPDVPKNFIVLSDFADRYNGSAMPDLVYGLGGNDNISLGGADDTVFGGGGNDVLDGEIGIDTAVFTGSRSQYSILDNGASITVSDVVAGRDGLDTLRNFEFLKFSDQTISTNLSPIYSLSASTAAVNEGATAIFTMTTTNVAAGTQVAYTLSGISAADVQGGVLTGTATVGANGQATISVSLLADSLTEGAETLTVTAGGKTASTTVNDTSRGSSTGVNGTSGNDVIAITSGSNSVDGGAGSDTVQYQTTRSAASVSLSNGTVTVSKANGTDTITGVERIDFTDGDLVFDVTSANAPAAYRLYGGAFARTPDEGGFRFWTSTLDTNVSLHDVASQFINSGEFIGRYGASLGNAAFVDALYQNVLGRGGDAGGVAHWNRMLDNKYQDRSDILVQFTQLPEFVGISAGNTTNGYWVV